MKGRHLIKMYSETINIEDGHVIRTVYAHWETKKTKGKTAVYMMDDEGREQVKDLDYCPIGGYLVWDEESDEWGEPLINVRTIRAGATFTKQMADKITLVYPDFKYVLDKAGKINTEKAIFLLVQWIKDPKIEYLVATKLNNLTYNKSFLKMGKDKQKAILRFVRENPGAESWHLNKIFFAMKRGTAAEYDKWQGFQNQFGKLVKFKWWKKYGEDTRLHRFYEDYLWMAKKCGHNTKDPYWEYPKDIMQAHDKVKAEYERILEAERIAREKQQRKELRKQKREFLQTVRKLEDCHVKAMKFTAFIPQDIDSVIRQAEFLHQCLITNDYIWDMAHRECVLVFITDEQGNPAATAEILPNGKIGQFYANQGKSEDMNPTEEQKTALDKWLAKFKDKAVKLMKKKAA